MSRTVVALLLALLLGACTTAPTPPSADESRRASAALARLLDDSDEAALERRPIEGLFRGDLRRAGRHGDFLSDAHVAAERAAARADLAALAAIPRAALAPAERIAYDTFAWQRALDLEQHDAPIAAVWTRLKPEHFDGWHLFFAQIASGDSVAPYRTPKDYDDGLSRLDGFIDWLDAAVARSREGLALGIVPPRFAVEHLVRQFHTFAAQPLDASPFYRPVRHLPDGFEPAQRERIRATYAAAVEQRLRPALARTRDFLAGDLLRGARDSVGLSALPGGAAYYRHLVRVHTSTGLTPAQIHRIGLDEVEHLTAAMQAVRREVGFDGSLAQFFERLREDPRFRPASADALLAGYRAIGERVAAALPRLFLKLPATPLEIRPTPAEQAPTDAAARYINGASDAARPAVFHVNTHRLDARPTFGMETLYLHEAMPGHHLQNSLVDEDRALPKTLRFGSNTAYAEGWALYAETLGPELGLFGDPYQRFGHLNDQMLRAMRLVVDTGLHTMGWTREQAIVWMLERSAMSRAEASAEVERYIGNPAQALAYKIGEATIRRLRTQAEAALGARFDLRAFHDQVLNTGALPLQVLQAKIEAWIAAGGR